MAKFKVGDKARVRRDLKIGWSYGEWCFNDKMKAFKGGELTIKRVHNDMYEVEENIWKWTDEMLEEVKESKMEKTFREVISDIKEGEVWEQTDSIFVTDKIMCKDGQIIIDLKQRRSSFGTKGIFKLQREEYTFEEAFAALENGKEIEDGYGMKYKISDSKHIEYKAEHMETWGVTHIISNVFSVDVIKGKWYIND